MVHWQQYSAPSVITIQTTMLAQEATCTFSNQRIESWWSSFRKLRAQFWIELFGDLRNEGHFNGSIKHQFLLQFCFQNVLQVDEFVELWNKHRIRPSRLAMCPGGITPSTTLSSTTQVRIKGLWLCR
ncbi:uncharacterized protein LOC125145715 [Tachysurus ichikawai]